MAVAAGGTGRATFTSLIMDETTSEHKWQNAKPFTMRRVVKAGSSVTGVPTVVKCKWTAINLANLNVFEGTIEEASSRTPCIRHVGCKGHLCASNNAYLIPYGFATGGEIISSDGSLLNQAVIHRDKDATDIADHCWKRIATKRGILRKSCNGCRPTNTFRLVASPGDLKPGVVQIPQRVMSRARFMHVNDNGRCNMKKLEVGSMIWMGRCPSQGKESALPMMIEMGQTNVNSVRIPLEVCPLTNADFDGDEMWMMAPMTAAGERELIEAWSRVWSVSGLRTIFASVTSVADANGIPDTVDPAMLTTMTFEEMGTHPGGKMYDDMILKQKSWKEMYRVMNSTVYHKSHVVRSEKGIVNTIMSRHGLAGPYGFMRMGMMMGTCVNVRENMLVIDSPYAFNLPIINVMPDVNLISCSSAMATLTRVMYQSGIDASKHGSKKGKVAAIDTLMNENELTYAMINRSGERVVCLMTNSMAYSMSPSYTNLNAIMRANNNAGKFETACGIAAMIEEIDGVTLTDVERISVAFFFVFLSSLMNSVVNRNPIDVMSAVGLDWYTSVTCSDVRWIKTVIRGTDMNINPNTSTDISSVLGAIFIGNMSMMTFSNSLPHRSSTVVASTNFSAGIDDNAY